MLLTDDEVQARLQEIQTVRVSLDTDPIANGLTSLNHKLSEVQLWKDRISFLLHEAIRNQTEAEILHESAQSEYDRQMDLLLATDGTVQAQKSEAMRSAYARTKMPELVLKLHHSEIEFIKASGYLKGLQSLISNLESANSNLSRQITVLQLSAGLGEIPNRGMQKTVNLRD
jgi:hypothetical protein